MNGEQIADTVQPFVFGISSAARRGRDKWPRRGRPHTADIFIDYQTPNELAAWGRDLDKMTAHYRYSEMPVTDPHTANTNPHI